MKEKSFQGMKSFTKAAKVRKPGWREGLQTGMLGGTVLREDRAECEAGLRRLDLIREDTESHKGAVVSDLPDCCV